MQTWLLTTTEGLVMDGWLGEYSRNSEINARILSVEGVFEVCSRITQLVTDH